MTTFQALMWNTVVWGTAFVVIKATGLHPIWCLIAVLFSAIPVPKRDN
jgi:hypothetical protein